MNNFLKGLTTPFSKLPIPSIFGIKDKSQPNDKGVDDRPDINKVPVNGRQSIPDPGAGHSILPKGMYSGGRIVYPEFLREVIPALRQLSINNPDISQAINNICTLGNTGHKIFFDQKVDAALQEKMRNHLENRRKVWSSGSAGMHGVINKMLSQVMIGGALSGEWVVNKTFNGIQGYSFVNPEDIYFELAEDNTTYQPWQRPRNFLNLSGTVDPGHMGMVKLNPMTYKYFALNGDTDLPYGFPPYTSALPRIETQDNMHKNIDFVTNLMGLLGFLEILSQKPQKSSSREDDAQYTARLTALLDENKRNAANGFKDGIVAGFKDDHEFKFNQVAKDYQGPLSLYENNEQQIFSAIKQDATLAGRSYNTSETQITVIFIKMLSELKNIQNIVKENLEYGYRLELLLAGYQFDSLKVVFNRSTIQDDLKYQQAEEIKLRNIFQKYLLGTISTDQAADELGYDAPFSKEPLVSPEVLAGQSDPALAAPDAKQKQDTKKKKTESDKKTRHKNKPISKK